MLIKSNFLIDDLRHINKTEIKKKVSESTQFSLSFVSLLIASAIISTLGLLMNSTAVVIGGMIISPLMWPLAQTALGISYGRPEYIKRAFIVLTVATLLSLLSALIITLLSPIKVLNDEIIARTTPTIVDLIVAIVSGVVASLAITQPKISESLAGVAIATSLMPPLCVAGIGLALLRFPIFWGGFLLYISNVVAIVFAAIIMFLWLGLKKSSSEEFHKKAISINIFLLVILGVPLFYIFRDVSFKAFASSKIESLVVEQFEERFPSAYVSSVRTIIPTDPDDQVLVDALVLMPEDENISFNDRQQIQASVSDEISRDVLLNLRLQNSLSLITEQDIRISSEQYKIREDLFIYITENYSQLSIENLSVNYVAQNDFWEIQVSLKADPSVRFTYADQEKIRSYIADKNSVSVNLDVDILSLVRVSSQPAEDVELLRQETQKLLSQNFKYLTPETIAVTTTSDSALPYTYLVNISARTTQENDFSEDDVDLLSELLNEAVESTVSVQMDVLKFERLISTPNE